MSRLDSFTCDEVFRRLDDFLDLELNPLEIFGVRAHLETCAACAHEYAFERSLLTELRATLRRVPVPATLRRRMALGLAGSVFRAHSFSCRLPLKRR